MTNPLLQVRGLRVDFPSPAGLVQAVRGVDWELAAGECLGIVGESGSGKSVSAAAVLGLLGPAARVHGSIQLEGQELTGLDKAAWRDRRGRTIAMIFQEPSRSFDPIYPIGKTFAESFRAHQPSLSDAEITAQTLRLLAEVQIPQPETRLGSFPHQFSGGMLQRLMIALALIHQPQVLIADEPTTALDVTIQAQIVRLLKTLQNQRRLSLVFISHNLALVGQIADRIGVMYGGLIVEIGPSSTVLGDPHSPYTRALLQALPTWGMRAHRQPLSTIGGQVPDPLQPPPGCPFAPRCPLVLPVCVQQLPELGPPGAHQFRCHRPGSKA